jgi:hypothetical protein
MSQGRFFNQDCLQTFIKIFNFIIVIFLVRLRPLLETLLQKDFL